MFAFAILSVCLVIEYTTSFGVKVKGLSEVKLKFLLSHARLFETP